MSRRRVKIDDLGAAISEILDEYGDHVGKATREVVKKVAKIAKQEVQAGANVKAGKYKKGWTVKENIDSRLRSEAIVHNRTRYQLAHLLEKGHALKRGGRSYGSVRAFPHIAPAEEHAIKNMEEALEKIAQG